MYFITFFGTCQLLQSKLFLVFMFKKSFAKLPISHLPQEYITNLILLQILLFAFSIILAYTNTSESTIVPVIIGITGISILSGSSIATSKIKNYGATSQDKAIQLFRHYPLCQDVPGGRGRDGAAEPVYRPYRLRPGPGAGGDAYEQFPPLPHARPRLSQDLRLL